jgi:hypothetical protein
MQMYKNWQIWIQNYFVRTVEDIYEGKPTSFDFDGLENQMEFRPAILTGLALL